MILMKKENFKKIQDIMEFLWKIIEGIAKNKAKRAEITYDERPLLKLKEEIKEKINKQ